MSKTLITGGSGMVGSQFKEGIKLSSIECDLKNQNEVNYAWKFWKPQYVIHLAAKVGGVEANMKSNADFFYDNVMINTNVIEACRKFGVERAAFFLSTCIFPDKIDYPLTEEKIHLGPGHQSNYGYSYAKRMAEVQVRSYNEQYKTKYFCVIPCNIYGPNDNFNLENGHVIPSLIHKVYLARENNLPYVEIWGNGGALREFIYSKDVVKITEKLLYETNFTGNIIVANNIEYPIVDILSYIIDIMNYKGEMKFLTDKPNGQFRKPSLTNKLESILGKQQYTPIYEGLKETIEWFENNYANIRK